MYTEKILYKLNDPNFGKRRVLKFDEPTVIDDDNINSIVSIIYKDVDEHDFSIITIYSNNKKQMVINDYKDLLNKRVDIITIDLNKNSQS